MNIQQISVHFTESAEEEIALIAQETGVIPLVNYLMSSDAAVPDELRGMLLKLISVVSDMFSSSLPIVGDNPEETLRAVSRDINLARVLRERGIFRLYRLVRQRTPDNVPLYMTLINPLTGSPFARQEEFIGWFCEEAHVARSLVFMRMGTIEKMQSIGFSLDETFSLTLAKPYAMRETLNAVASWEGGQLKDINPNVAIQVARRVSPDAVPELRRLAEIAGDSPEAMREFREAVKPVLADLVTEVANHERARDALDFVRYDVLMRAEVNYSWDRDAGVLLVELVRKHVDSTTGEEYMGKPEIVPFVPDTNNLPKEIVDDLFSRLPIRNKFALDS